jgi:serine/threonine-protein phosphatase PP1 catalytic subunit
VFKLRYAQHFFMLRGNHKCRYMDRFFGFYNECVRMHDIGIWRLFCDVLMSLPFAAVVDSKAFCVHRGISPELDSRVQIRQTARPCEAPQEGLSCDLFWADPNNRVVRQPLL